MTHRIAKKWAARFSASALSIPLTMDHAKPSLSTLPFGTARNYTYRQSLQLGLRPRVAWWATRRAYVALRDGWTGADKFGAHRGERWNGRDFPARGEVGGSVPLSTSSSRGTNRNRARADEVRE